MKSKKLKLKKEVVCILKEKNLHIGQGGAGTLGSSEIYCEESHKKDIISIKNCGETGRCVPLETLFEPCKVSGAIKCCSLVI